MAQPARVALGIDERNDVGMIAPQRRHHRAAAGAGRLDGGAHGVPDIHERHRSRGNGAGRARASATRADRREIVADTTAALHRHRAFFQRAEDAGDRVLDRAHDEAVEQGHVAIRAGPGLDPPARQELEVLQDVEEALLPFDAVGRFDLSQCVRDTPPGRLHRRFGSAGAIARLPHMTRDRRIERLVRSHRGTIEMARAMESLASSTVRRCAATSAGTRKGGTVLAMTMPSIAGVANNSVAPSMNSPCVAAANTFVAPAARQALAARTSVPPVLIRSSTMTATLPRTSPASSSPLTTPLLRYFSIYALPTSLRVRCSSAWRNCSARLAPPASGETATTCSPRSNRREMLRQQRRRSRCARSDSGMRSRTRRRCALPTR